MAAKRNPSDAQAEARRQSFSEMNRKQGYFGKLWHEYTRSGPAQSEQK
jgi:hypothetical protein